MTMNGNQPDETRVGTGSAGQAPDVPVASPAPKALYDEARAIRERFEQFKSAGPEGKAERDRLRQRYQEIDRLITLSRAQAKEGAKDGGTRKAPGDAEEWAVGDVILDRYEVKAELGEGGMGKVFRVHDLHWNMDLAVKTPKESSFQTNTQKANFLRECHTWMDLGLHSHIVTCHYVRVLGGIPRVFTEYVEGGSLKDWIDEGKLYEGGTDRALERILDIAIQFAMGLHYAHEKGLVHQDIKPANVMMTPEAMVKLTDFGLANARGVIGETVAMPQGASILASYGGMTPAYCSPEQADLAARRQAGTPAKQIPKLTRRTDLYSWAVSVLEMFTGAVTWQAGNAANQALESYLQHGSDDDELPKMSGSMAELLRQCLQQDPGARPHDMGAVADALRGMYETVTGRAYPREAPALAPEPADVLNNKAVSLAELGCIEESLELFDESLGKHPGHLPATFNQILVLWRTGRESTADMLKKLAAFEAMAPNEPEAPLWVGHIRTEMADFNEAVKAYRRAEDLGAGDVARLAREQAATLVPQEPRCVRTFEGHMEEVSSVCLSADGRFALSCSVDKTLRLWDVTTSECVRVFKGHEKSVYSVCLSADGRWALSGSADRTLRLWDVATGKFLRIFEGHTDSVYSVCLSTDGRWALSGSGDKTLRLWDATTGECVRVFTGHSGRVNSVCLSADGRWALSGGDDKALSLWDVTTGECVRGFEGHTAGVKSVCISADGRWALSGSNDGMVHGGHKDGRLRLWDVTTGECVRIFGKHSGGLSNVCLSADGRWALSMGSYYNSAHLLEVSTGRCVHSFGSGYMGSETSVCLSADGRLVLVGYRTINRGKDDTVRLFDLGRLTVADLRKLTPLALCRVKNSDKIMQASDDIKAALKQAKKNTAVGDWCAALEVLRTVRETREGERAREVLDLWHAAGLRGIRTGLRSSWHLLTFGGHKSHVNSVCLSGDGRWALSGGGHRDKTLRLWDLATGECVRVFEGHTSIVNSVCLSGDGRWALSGGGYYQDADNTPRLWDVGTGKCVRVFEEHTDSVNSVCLSGDGRWALSGSRDRTLRLWEVASGKCVRTFKGHTLPVSSASLSGDGRWALSGSSDKMLRLWDVATGQCIRVFEGHTNTVESVCLSADRHWALSGSADRTLRLWDVATGQCVRVFDGHTHWVSSVFLSADGHWALSGSSDKTLRLWEVSTGECIRTLEGHTEGVNSVCLSANGRWVLSGGGDDNLRLWELDWDYEAREPADWDVGVRPYLENFLTLHTPYAASLPDGEADDVVITRALTREGTPKWTEDDFKQLLDTLAYANYGWLRPEAVRKKLDQMAACNRSVLGRISNLFGGKKTGKR